MDCHTPSSKPYRLGPPSSQKEKGSIPTPEKSPSPNTNFHVIQASFIATSLLLYHFFNFRLYVHIYHANFDSLMVTESYLQNDKTTEWPKFLQVKFPTPLHFSMPFGKPCFKNSLFSFLLLPFFISNLINFLWLHSSCDFIASKIVKYRHSKLVRINQMKLVML